MSVECHAWEVSQKTMTNGEVYIRQYEEFKKNGYRQNLYIREAGKKGMGVFAMKGFAEGEVVEFCHVVIMGWQSVYQRDPAIVQYAYPIPCHCKPSPDRPACLLNCPKNGQRVAMPLGFGCIYNSADKPEDANLGFLTIPDERLMVFVAKREIAVDEELVTWWGQGYFNSWCKKDEQVKR